jgi:hypothetical protein
MHTPQALRFDEAAPSVEPQGLTSRHYTHMPSALQFDDTPGVASPAPGAQPRALDLGPAPTARAVSLDASAMLGSAPVNNAGAVPPLPESARALASKRGLTPEQVSSVERQAQSLTPLHVDVVDAWGAQVLEQHTNNVATVSVLRDRINAACLGDVFARASAAQGTTPAQTKPSRLAGVITGLLHGSAPKTAADNLDDLASRARQGGLLAKGFAQELQTLQPGCLNTRDRLAILLTSLEVAMEAATNQGSTQDAAPEMARARVRQDMLSRAFVQAGLLSKTLETLAQNTAAWIDQAEYIQNVLIPARRLAQS